MHYQLNDVGLLKISGKDAKKFLQGQLTCDVEKAESRPTLGAHCNPQGRVLSLFTLFYQQDAYYLAMPKSLLPIAEKALKKYAVFYSVTLESNNKDFVACMNAQSAFIQEDPITLTLPNKLQFVLEKNSNATTIDTNAWLKDTNAWLNLLIDAKVPTIYPETSGKFLPHELDLPALGAISFDKGCYTGQEIIARMHYRGKLKSHLYVASIASTTAPLPGDAVYDAQQHPVGTVVSAASAEKLYNTLIITDEAHASQPLFNHHSQAFELKAHNE